MTNFNDAQLQQLVGDERSFAKLYDIAMQSNRLSDFLDDFLGCFIPSLPNHQIVPAGCVFMQEWSTKEIRHKLTACYHLPDELMQNLQSNKHNINQLGSVVEQKNIQFARGNIDAFSNFEIDGQKLFGILYIPMIINDEVIGVLQLFQVEVSKPSAREIHFYSQAAKIMVQGISQRRNLDKWIRAYRELEVSHVSLISRLNKMSKDLSAPITAVSGLSEQIFNKKIVPIKDQSLLLKNTAAHLKNLFKKLTQQIDFGPKGIQLENQLFSFNDSFTSLLDELRMAVHEKDLEFSFRVDQDIPASLIGDVGKVQQVLFILIDNAIKFTEHGKISLVISIHHESVEQLILQFEVRDTGMGMTEKARKNLFSDAINANLKISGDLATGKGGLVLAKKMVEMMKGDINVSSHNRSGSQFTFTAQFTKYDKSDNRNTVESTLTMAAISVQHEDLFAETTRIMQEHHELIEQQLNTLYKTVCEFNMDSINEIEKLITVLKNTVYRDDLRIIKKAIKAYDYSNATHIIEDFSNTLHIELNQ